MARYQPTEARVEETDVECDYRDCDRVFRLGDAYSFTGPTRSGPFGDPGVEQHFCTEEHFELELGAVVDQHLDQQAVQR